MSSYVGFNIMLIGTNGVGKSTYCKRIIQKYKGNCCLVSDDDAEEMFNNYVICHDSGNVGKYKGKFRHFVGNLTKSEKEAAKQSWTDIYHDFSGLIFIDDGNAVFSIRPEHLMYTYRKRRQKQCDILINCHGASEFPKSLYKYLTHVVVFKTLDSTKDLKQRMSLEAFHILNQVIEYVNEKSQQDKYYYVEVNMLTSQIKKPNQKWTDIKFLKTST